MTDETEVVLEDRLDQILVLRMNRPHRHHALSRELSAALTERLKAAEQDDQVRVVVLTGTGDKAFCAGADMLESSGVETAASSAPKSTPADVIDAFAKTPLPVIAAINGYCYGGGAALAIACDIRLASANATFRLPGAEYGLVVAAASLPRLIGAPKAKELIYTARKFDAREAFDDGLLNAVHPHHELMPQALEMAQAIAANSVAAVRASKAVIDLATLSHEAQTLELETNRELRGSPEQRDRFRSATKKVTGR